MKQRSVFEDINELIAANPGKREFQVTGVPQEWVQPCLHLMANYYADIEYLAGRDPQPEKISYTWDEATKTATLVLPKSISPEEMRKRQEKVAGVLFSMNNNFPSGFYTKQDKSDVRAVMSHIMVNEKTFMLLSTTMSFLTIAHGFNDACHKSFDKQDLPTLNTDVQAFIEVAEKELGYLLGKIVIVKNPFDKPTPDARIQDSRRQGFGGIDPSLN